MGIIRRSIRTSFCALLAIVAVSCSSKTADTPEDLARMAFEALKKGSPHPLRGCTATVSDIEELMDLIRDKADQEIYEAIEEYVDERGGAAKLSIELADRFKESFATSRSTPAGSRTPIDWSSAEFEGFEAVNAEELIEGGPEVQTIHIRVRAGEETFTFLLDNCIKVERGWILHTIHLVEPPG